MKKLWLIIALIAAAYLIEQKLHHGLAGSRKTFWPWLVENPLPGFLTRRREGFTPNVGAVS